MKKFLLAVSLLTSARAADLPYWIEPCSNRDVGCLPEDTDLAKWALEAWEQASSGKLHFVASDRDNARLRMVWADQTPGLYGETMSIRVHGLPGAQINLRVADNGTKDRLMHDTIVYLTCLHESGHALGLDHTAKFADIMYTFQYGGDIPEYFARYRRKLTVREDIRKNSGLSAEDRAHLLQSIASK